MKKRAIVLAGIALALVLVGVYLWGPSSVPAGQGSLIAISKANFGEFENAFDGDLDTPRLLLLLSPT
jgi:hypothetical protein